MIIENILHKGIAVESKPVPIGTKYIEVIPILIYTYRLKPKYSDGKLLLQPPYVEMAVGKGIRKQTFTMAQSESDEDQIIRTRVITWDIFPFFEPWSLDGDNIQTTQPEEYLNRKHEDPQSSTQVATYAGERINRIPPLQTIFPDIQIKFTHENYLR